MDFWLKSGKTLITLFIRKIYRGVVCPFIYLKTISNLILLPPNFHLTPLWFVFSVDEL